MSGETLRIRQFHSDEEFRIWWESDEIVRLRQNSSSELADLTAHPWIKPWLDKMPAQSNITTRPIIQAPALIGEQFGKYTVEKKLGQGGMGVVYLAFDAVLKRHVALKVMSGESAESRERFLREAQSSAKLRHPHIIQVYEIGTEGRYHYFTMEYIEGESLHDLIGRGESPRRIAEIIAKIASALHYAHSQQLVHRDIKPANILIDRKGEPYLTDFGLAKELTGLDRSLTMSGMVVGTPDYMAPEQAKGNKENMDNRSDIFSLGATLYHALTGKLPFQGKELYEVMEKVVHYDPVPPTRLVHSLSWDIETICLKCLEKEPSSRYQTAQDLSDDLLRFVRGELIMARPSGLVTIIYKRAAKNKIASFSVAGALLVLIAVGVWLTISSARNKELVVKYRLEAEELFRKNDYNEAKVRASKALALLPNDRAMHDLIRKCDEILGENETRLKKARDARDQAKGVLGRLNSISKPMSDDRIKVAQDALKIDPGFDEAWLMLGRAYKDKLDFYKAEDAFAKAIEANPKLAYAYYERAEILREIRKDIKGAVADYGKVVELDPGSHIGYFAKGVMEYRAGHVDEAMKSFDEAIRQKKDYAEAYDNRAVVKTDQGDIEGAIKDYDRAVQIRPDYSDAYYNRGTVKYNHGDAAGSIVDFTKAIELEKGNDVEAYYCRGLAREKTGDITGALKDFDRVLESKPEHHNAYIWRAIIRDKRGDVDGAMDDYTMAIQLKIDERVAYNNRGALRYDRGDIVGALEDIDNAIRLDPKYATAYVKRGTIKKDRGDIDGALGDYNTAIEINPKLSSAYTNRGIAKKEKGDLDGAFKDYDKALDLDPNSGNAYYNRGMARLAMGDNDEALKDFTMAIQLNPNDAIAYTGRGNIRDLKKDAKGALEDYDKSILIDPKYANAYFNRGVTKYEKGDIEGAVQDYNKALELDPKDARAYYSRGIIKYERNDIKGALKDYDQAIKLKPDYTDAYYNRGTIKSEVLDINGAIKDYSRAIELEPKRADLYISRALAWEKKMDAQAALNDYSQSLKLEPGSAVVYASRGTLKRNMGDIRGAIEDYTWSIKLKPDLASTWHNRAAVKYAGGDTDGAVQDLTQAIKLKPDYIQAYFNRALAYEKQQKYAPALADFEKVLGLDSGPELKAKAREMIEKIKGK